MDKQCLNCQQMYLATRSSSKYCSDKCRKQANRDINDDLSVPNVTLNTKRNVKHYIYEGKAKYFIGRAMCTKCDYEIDLTNEWSHSACWKTKAEIEAHYTLTTFPRRRYHSTNGGGTGSYSPYRTTDPRSKAYLY